MTEPGTERGTVVLPASVRQRVVVLAAEALGRLPADQVPASLKAVARFAPARRAKAGAGPLAAALESDPVLRQRVAVLVRDGSPDLAGSIVAGTVPPAADPVEVAALAYLLRPDGWTRLVEGAVVDVHESGRAADLAGLQAEVDRLSAQVAQARAATERLTAEAASREQEVRAELAAARRRTRELEADVGRARASADASEQASSSARATADALTAEAVAEARRLRVRVAELESALDAARRAAREGRAHDDVRLRLLLDTVVGAAQGLRQELALPPTDAVTGQVLPADAVATGHGAAAAGRHDQVGGVRARALAADDPAMLEQLLGLSRVHLLVDGYNVTKTGYGALSLEQQRARLVSGLGALAARTRAEVTCVFDGTSVAVPVGVATPRGVRVLFSADGRTADQLLDQLVRAEPAGRPLVVVSTDGEVAARAAAAGARAVPSRALLRLLDRG